MGATELYRQRALECSALANFFSDPEQRTTMRLLATCWLRLLEQTSDHGEKPGDAGPSDADEHPSAAHQRPAA
jgi:hypothetical protein